MKQYPVVICVSALALLGSGGPAGAEQWLKEGVRIDLGSAGAPDSSRAQDPSVVVLTDQSGQTSYRMYYAGYVGLTTAVLSAVSTDGLSWSREPGIRLQILQPSEFQTIEPDVVQLPDGGGFRMYYAAVRRNVSNWFVGSAYSADGLSFQVEPGARVDGGTDFIHAWSPDVATLSGGGYRMYYGVVGTAGWEIRSAVSSDGLNWSREPGIRVAGSSDPAVDYVYDPEVRALPEGGLRMYYVGGDSANFERIYSATSADGLAWTHDPGVRIPLGGLTDPDHSRAASPEIVAFPTGLRMYYGGREGGASAFSRHRVLSAFLEDPNQPPVAMAGSDQIVECAGPSGTTVTLDGSGSFDPDGSALTYDWRDADGNPVGTTATVDVVLPLGMFTFTLTVDDGGGGTDSDTVAITVQDTEAPSIDRLTATPGVLWPPNHKLVPVTVAADVTDACSGAVGTEILGVTSSEPVTGPGDRTSPDRVINGPLAVDLRAERTGRGAGRVYTIEVQAVDALGNASTAAVEVTVPHDRGN